MKNSVYLLIFVFIFTSSCKQEMDKGKLSVIPQPVEMKRGSGFFYFTNKTKILYRNENLSWMVNQFTDSFTEFYEEPSDSGKKYFVPNKFILSLDSTLNLPFDGYHLEIRKKLILLDAPSHEGIFRGLQTLSQLIFLNTISVDKVTVPVLEITDYPRFNWRGMMIDVSRHFMPSDDLKKIIDYMALYKYNKLHWHLTDDQGWRIEIKKYPLLTEIGAWRDSTLKGHYSDEPVVYNKERHGGFYTQEEIKDIIEYARLRFIEVIPEIEMPGHAKAAIAAYPELGVTGEKTGVKSNWGISPYIYSPKESSFEFLENVLEEVISLFPSEYIHIGGDEAIKDQWEESEEVQELIKALGLNDEHELQSWFIKRIERFLNSNNKKLIGWDEILEGGLAPNATVMSWRGMEGGKKAAEMGHDVIMSPTSHAYFDYYQAKPIEKEQLAIGGYLPIEKVYSLEPVPEELSKDKKKHILGAQANVWTEYINNREEMEYMIFPRMLAMSEVTWTLAEQKNTEHFLQKVKDHELLFEILGVNYSKSGMPD